MIIYAQADFSLLAHPPSVDRMGVERQIREIRKATGWTQQEVAKEFGVSQSTVNRWESRGAEPEGPNRDAINALYAEKVQKESKTPPGAISAKLISWVSAGALLSPDAEPQDEDAPIMLETGLDPNGDWIALRVDGDSMNRISPHDSVIFVNRRERQLVPNACYIIGDGNGGATYKRYRPPNIWEPVSTNPVHKPIMLSEGTDPDVVGRVRKTILIM